MKRWGDSWRARARRVAPALKGSAAENGKVVLVGARQVVRAELYNRTRLSVSGRLYKSLTLQVTGNAFVVGFDTAIAPYAKIRLDQTGRSKTGGHRLDVNPNAYLRANIYPRLRARLVLQNRQIIGPKQTVTIKK